MGFSILFCFLAILFIILVNTTVSFNALADIPLIPRTEIWDGSRDWMYEHDPTFNGLYLGNSSGVEFVFGVEAASRTDCKEYNQTLELDFPVPDISSVSYASDGKNLTTTLWLSKPANSSNTHVGSASAQTDNASISQGIYTVEVFNNVQNKGLEEFAADRLEFLKMRDPSFHLFVNESENGMFDNDVHYKKLTFLSTGQPYTSGESGDQCRKCKSSEFLAINDDRLFIISYTADTENFDSFILPVNDMTYSTKFLDKESAALNTSIYESGNFRIRFDYPADWQNNTVPTGTRESNVLTLGNNTSTIRVLVDNTIYGIKDLTPKNYLNEIIKFHSKNSAEFKVVEASTGEYLGNIPGYNLTYTYNDNGTISKLQEIGAIVGDDKVYKIQYYSSMKDYLKNQEQVQSLINSFQFQVYYLTYTNYGVGLKMNYPYNWASGEQTYSRFGYMNETFMGGIAFASPIKGPELISEAYLLLIEYDSVYGRQHPYQVLIYRNSTGSNWIENITEFSLQGQNQTIYSDSNYSDVNLEKGFVKISIDPGSLNLPDKFLVYSGKQISYILNGVYCWLDDYTDYTSIPAPKYLLTTEPNSITDMRPGESEDINVILTSLVDLPFKVTYSSENTSSLQSTFNPSLISGNPRGNTSSTMKIVSLTDAMQGHYTIPIKVDIVFDPTFNLENTTSAHIIEKSTLSVTLLPPKDLKAYLDDIVAWLSPLNSVLVFITAVAAVVSPLFIQFYKKKRDKKNNSTE